MRNENCGSKFFTLHSSFFILLCNFAAENQTTTNEKDLISIGFAVLLRLFGDNDGDERGWYTIGSGLEYTFTVTPENIERGYRVVLFAVD